MVKIYLVVLLHFEMQRNKNLGVSITKEIVSYVLLAVASYLHVGSAMIESAIIQWIGNFVLFISYVILIGLSIILIFNFYLQEGYD